MQCLCCSLAIRLPLPSPPVALHHQAFCHTESQDVTIFNYITVQKYPQLPRCTRIFSPQGTCKVADQTRTADDYPTLDVVGAYVQGGASPLLSAWPCAIQDHHPWRGRGVEGSCRLVLLLQERREEEEACASLCQLVQLPPRLAGNLLSGHPCPCPSRALHCKIIV